MRPQLLLLDFDGTLADSFEIFVAAFNDAAVRYGLRPIMPGDRDRLRALPPRDIAHELGIPAWRMPAVARHVRRRMHERAAEISLFDGIAQVLDALRRGGVRLAVVTSNSEDTVRAVLGSRASHVERYECGVSVLGKSRRFRRAVRALDADFDTTMAVGDEQRDAEAAREAGIAFGGVLWGYARADVLARAGCARLFREPADLLTLL